jgi:hypothetical protein
LEDRLTALQFRGYFGSAKRVVLAEIVVPEPVAGIWIIVEDRESEIGKCFDRDLTRRLELPDLHLRHSYGARNVSAKRSIGVVEARPFIWR